MIDVVIDYIPELQLELAVQRARLEGARKMHITRHEDGTFRMVMSFKHAAAPAAA